MSIKTQIIELYNRKEFSENDKKLFLEFRNGLNSGEIRAAEKIDGNWITNNWVKKGILAGFKMGKIVKLGSFMDKDTYPVQDLT
ncbi:MAG: 2,3,4,5-tetrahydropyridine-2,6-dicarboxylate N-succinyltransferase, partial [Candidatus Cloacimonetes bacterium]|nr:2,3,4,5-tetrahydropyridine-2,6-dicarboxylate N-succinyltransferase [Candidatus Cloacimonadota bacterium]